MSDRIARWDERYAAGEGAHGFEPAPVVVAAAALAPRGIALDLACGAGRNAIHLASLGWRVVAVDASRVGIATMMDEARRRGVEANIEAHVADLESSPRGFSPEPGRYDLVLDVYFLDRTLFAEIRDAVRPGGLLAVAIHTDDPSASPGMSPSFLLAPGELRAMVAGWGWEIVHEHESGARETGHRRASSEVVARRPDPR